MTTSRAQMLSAAPALGLGAGCAASSRACIVCAAARAVVVTAIATTTMVTSTIVASTIGALAAAWPSEAHAADVLYRCTDAEGRVTWQNRNPCAKGQQQQIRHVEVPPARTPPVVIPELHGAASAPPATTPASALPAAAAAPAPRAVGPLPTTATPPNTTATPPPPRMPAAAPVPTAALAPPPALWRCLRWDGDDSVQESATPATHCKPLATTGLDGDAQNGAGSACETVHDTCTPVPQAALCTVWKNRVDEARFRWRYAGDGPAATARKAEYDALDARYAGSSCAQ